MTTWDVFDSRSDSVRRGLDDDAIHSGLADGTIRDDDFARPSEGGRYLRLHDIPELAHVVPGAGRRSARRRTALTGIDLTPMVDVVFLLLLFFMLTATYSAQSTIEVPRPDQSDKGAQQAPQTLEELSDKYVIVQIGRDDSILVDDVPTTPEQLDEAIRSARRDRGRNELILSADPDAHHETVVLVLDAANVAGMQRIQMANPVSESGGP